MSVRRFGVAGAISCVRRMISREYKNSLKVSGEKLARELKMAENRVLEITVINIACILDDHEVGQEEERDCVQQVL